MGVNEKTEVGKEVGKEVGHREGSIGNVSGEISLEGEKGVHRTPSPFPSLEEGVRHKTTRSGRAAQPGQVMTSQSRTKGFNTKEDTCRMSVSVKDVKIDDMKALSEDQTKTRPRSPKTLKKNQNQNQRKREKLKKIGGQN